MDVSSANDRNACFPASRRTEPDRADDRSDDLDFPPRLVAVFWKEFVCHDLEDSEGGLRRVRMEFFSERILLDHDRTDQPLPGDTQDFPAKNDMLSFQRLWVMDHFPEENGPVCPVDFLPGEGWRIEQAAPPEKCECAGPECPSPDSGENAGLSRRCLFLDFF